MTKLPLVDSHWNAQLQVIKDYDIASHFVAFSLDSSLLAYVCFHGIIKLLDARTGECIASLRGHKSVVTCIIFLPDSRIGQLASASEDGTIKIWDITTEECISTLGGGNDEIESIVYLPGPRPMLAAATETSITAWNLETKKCTATLKHNHDGGGNRMSMAVIGGAGLLISSGSYDSSIKVWDMASNSCIKTLKGHTDRVNSIAVSPDSSMIASASGDGTIILWDAAERSSIATLQNHSKPVKSVDFLSASMLASASDDGAVRIWDTSRHTCLATLLMSGYDPDFVVFTYAAASHDARLLASVVGTHICIWDVAIAVSSEGATTKNPPDRQAKAYGFSQDSTVFASGSTNGNIQIWNTISGELKQTLAGQSGTIRKITIWPDSTRIASMSDNGIIRLWDTKTGKCIKTLLGHKGEGLYPQLALSPDLTTLASSLNNIVKLWDVKTVAFRKHSFLRKGYFSRYGSGKAACIATLDATYFVNGMAFSPDSDLLAIASRGITIWDWATCTRLHTIDTRLSMSSIAFLRNARVLSCDLVGDLRLWDLATGTCLSTFEFGEGFYHLDSDESGSSIRTDRGFLTFQHPLSSTLAPSEDSRSQAVQIGVGLSADKTWVTWDECKILWLPPIYRAKEWVFNTRVTGPRIVIGLSLGRPFISITVDEIALSQLKSLSPRSSLASNSDADFQDGDEEDFQDSEEEDFQDSDEEETHQA